MNCTGRMNDGIYNCYGEHDHCLCYDCVYNSESEEKEKQNRFVSYKDKFEVLYKFLLGIELPKGVTCNMPKLSCKKAFSVIWFLQEIMHCLPDNIEQCQDCKELYDTDSSGFHLDEEYTLDGKPLPKKYRGNWCDGCVPDVDFQIP